MRARSVLPVLLAAAGLVVCAAPAQAASGSLTDPRGDTPDIVKLAYNNAATRVQMTMTYADIRFVDNESFYLAWGTAGARYQVFSSRTNGVALRYYPRTNAAQQTVPCPGLTVVQHADLQRTTITLPRTCIRKAPDRLRFQGVATAGLSESDQTRYSPVVARG